MLKRNLPLLVTLGASLALLSCGQRDSDQSPNELMSFSAGERASYPQNIFSPADIAALYSDATETRADGKIYPVSRMPNATTFAYSEATAEYKKTWGTFDFGAELKGYFNAGPASLFQYIAVRVIRNFETLSGWKTIKKSDGSQVFSDSFRIDEASKKIPDAVDGTAPATGEVHLARLTVSMYGVKIPVDTQVILAREEDHISMKLLNLKSVTAPLLGTIVRERQLKINVDLYPHKNGWLVYGGSAVTLEKYKDQFDTNFTRDIMIGVFTWARERSILPIN
jgi:hypothetical protein